MIRKTASYFFIPFIVLLVFFWRSASAFGEDGIIIYDETSPTGNIQSRTWTQSSGTVGGESSPFAGTGVSKFVIVKSAAAREETLLGIQDSGGALAIYRSINNGSSWSTEWSATVGDGNLARFDIAYEDISGDALVVYSANVGTTNEIKYQTWNGSSWSGALNLDTVRTSGIVYGIEITARNGSNEIGVVFVDDALDLSANLWNGSAWYGEPGAAFTTSLSKMGTSTVPTNKAFDLAFESVSGDLMVIWGIDATADPRYVIKTAGGAWGSTQTAISLIEEPTMLDISPSPISDKIAYMNGTDNGSDCDFGVWSGSAWGTAANDTTCGAIAAGYSGNEIRWLVDGTNEVALLVYTDAAGGGIDWYQSTNGGTPIAQADNTIAPAVAGIDRAISSELSPSDRRQGLVLFTDANSDIFVKKVSLSGTTVSWVSVEPGGVALETSASAAGFNPVGFEYSRVNTLTTGVSGMQSASLVSGDTAQHIGGGSTAAFTLQVTSSATLSSVTVSDIGAIEFADLTTPRLYYETAASCAYDGAETNVAGLYAGEAAAFSFPSVSVGVAPNMTCLYLVFDVDGGAFGASGGETIDVEITNPSTDITVSGALNSDTLAKSLSGITTIKPNATSVTYGAGLSDGGRSGESITISGFGFGSAPSLSRANCLGGVNTGCARFIAGGSTTVSDPDISAWSNTAITFTVIPTLASQGGVSSLEVVSGSQNDATPLIFYIYPNVTGMTTCGVSGDRDSSCGTNAAEVYDSADAYGLIQLNGDHFGILTGSAQFTGTFGELAGTIHNTVEGPCVSAGWNSGSVCLEVNPSIGADVYDGTVTIARNSDFKTDAIDLHILPRIAANSPVSGAVGALIAIDGNHFCQTGSCPPAPPTSDYRAYFGSTSALSADFATSCSGGSKWSHTQVCVKVPIGTPPGSQKTKIQGLSAPLYESERETFTVQTSVPNDPADLAQFKSDGSTPIAIGGMTNESSVVLKADLSASISIDMALQVEVKDTGVLFDETGVIQGTSPEGACASCTSLNDASVVAAITDGAKHWRARVKNTATSEYSNWVSFGGNGETETDFARDTTAPTIIFPGGDTCAGAMSNVGTNGATISWSLNESADGQVEYSVNSDLSGSSLYPIPPAISSVSHAITLSNLFSGATYYFKVKSRDSASNLAERPAVSPFCSFATGSVTQPGKTTSFFIAGTTAALPSASDYYFTVFAPENGIAVKDAHLEVNAIVTGGTNPIGVQVNGVALKNYSVDAVNPALFTFVYQIANPGTETNLNLNDGAPCTNGAGELPPCNKLTITPGGGMTLYAASARLIVTYGYSP